MAYIDKHIVETYTDLFEGLNNTHKTDLIESLSKSLKEDEQKKDKKFYKSFGAFGSNKSPEKIISEIKAARKFKTREISL